MEALSNIFHNIYGQMALLLAFATLHGYAGAWLAVRMLFRPREPVKFLGITVFPQGMIPRHRDRLAMAVGKAVGEELVSQETIIHELTSKDFLRNKIQNVVDSYTSEILSQEYPSLIEALPPDLRGPVLDAISALESKLADHIKNVLKSEESLEAIRGFVSRRADVLLGQRVSDIVDDRAFDRFIGFITKRIHAVVRAKSFETTLRDFVGQSIDDLMLIQTPLSDMLTPDAVSFLKEKATEQIEPAVHHLTEIAAAERTRSQIGALIKHEVHAYYENLPFIKKMFVSRENLLGEVDDLVNESLPRRIEETLRGEFFAEEARNFINTSIDNALSRPLPVVLGNLAPEQLLRLKEQITHSLLSFLRSERTLLSIGEYIRTSLEKFRPHSIDAILQLVHPESEETLKSMLSRGLLEIIAREETSGIVDQMLKVQMDRLLSRPIGRLADHIPETKLREASTTLTDAIIAATTAKLPEAIAEFDVGGMVRDKVQNYPPEKLESLVLSVAKEHLHKIELFGALFGFAIGVVQAIQFYMYAK